MRQALSNQRGFTLTELLVVAAVLALILAAVVLIQQKGQESYLMGSSRVETQQNARVALDTMTRELRPATAIVAIGGSTDVTFADQNGTQIRYSLSGTTLNRTQGGVDTPLMGGVQSLTLTFYSAYNSQTNTGTTTLTPGEVRVIKISLVAKTEEAAGAGSPASQSATMESMIRLRNL